MYNCQPNSDTQEYNRTVLKVNRRELRKHGTPAEAVLWKNLKGRQVLGMRFRRQFSVGPYILDFYCPDCKVCIELDGEGHYTPEGAEYDEARTEYLMQVHGISVLRFENCDVFNTPEGVMQEIEEMIRLRMK